MQQSSNSHNRNRQLSQSGDVASLRFSFAFFRVDERYRDLTPIETCAIIPNSVRQLQSASFHGKLRAGRCLRIPANTHSL